MTAKEKLELCIYRMMSAINLLSHEKPSEEKKRHALSHCQSTKQTLEMMLQEFEEDEKVQELSPHQEEV